MGLRAQRMVLGDTVMAGMPAPQPDPKQQLDAAHPIAPPAANQTTAVADAVNSVTPQGIALNAFLNKFNSTVKDAAAPAQKFADGTANVQPNRRAAGEGYLTPASWLPYDFAYPASTNPGTIANSQQIEQTRGPNVYSRAPDYLPPPSAPTAAGGTANVQPVLPAAVANDPGWAARVALHNTLNPGNGVVPDFPAQPGIAAARVAGLPLTNPSPVGAPTPTFAPIPRNANEASNILSAVTGTPAHLFAAPMPAPVQGQPVTQGGRSVTPAAAPVSGPMRSYDNGNVQMTPGPISYVGPAPHEIPGTPEHTIANARNMSSDTFVNAMRGVPGARVMQIMEALRPPSMQEQAARLAVQGAAQQGPSTLQKMLIYLGLPQNAMFAQPAQGAVSPDGQ